MALEVYLVRHGQTVFNVTGRLQGWSDSPLTAEGRAAAERLGQALRKEPDFDAAFSSDSPRAAETAALILAAKGQSRLPVHPITQMREYCFGGFEGELAQALYERLAEQSGYASPQAWLEAYRSANSHLLAQAVSSLDTLGLAETEAKFVQRLNQGLERVLKLAPKEGKILLVSHGMAITAVLKMIDQHSTLYKSVKNATVSRLFYEKGMWKIGSIGEEIG